MPKPAQCSPRSLAGTGSKERTLVASGSDLLNFYRSEIQFESGMLSGRLNSFMTSQSFILIAYGSSMGALVGQWDTTFTLLFPPSLALLGLVLALQTLPGIHAAYRVIEEWHDKQQRLLVKQPELEVYFRMAFKEPDSGRLGPTAQTRFRQGTVFTRHSPWILSVVWCYFLTLPFVMHIYF
jgi:hypothetical protein